MKKLLAVLTVLCLLIPIAIAQEALANGLTGIKAEDPAGVSKLLPEFDPTVKDYVMYVQSDVYGVRFTPEFAGADKATVFLSGDGIDPSHVTVASGESFVLDLSQLQSMYRREVISTASLVVGNELYTFTVRREDGSYLYDAFDLKTYAMPDGHDMNYWLYVPDDYDPNHAYPVVLYLHGGGQTSQTPDMIIKRTQQAGSFLRYGYGDCIIIAPHANYTTMDSEVTGWASDGDATIFGQAAYQIVQNVKAEFNVDANRIYVTGGSMGGAGTQGMISTYPEEFAAALACCAGTNTDKLVSALKASPVPLWLVFATEDPVVKFEGYEKTSAALDAAGIPYNSTIYDESVFLYPTAHFNWMPAYANPEILSWMFSQSKGAQEGELIDLKFEESSQKVKLRFNPEITEYELTVQSDIYGVRLTPYGNGTFTINDTQVKGGESFELALSEEPDDYRKELTYEIKITDANKTYTLKVIREDGSYHYDAFNLNTFELPDGKEMYYWLSVPENYDPGKQYPVVLSLHGSGQKTQEPEMILKRVIQANAFVKLGYEAIVIAPQCNYTDLSYEGEDLSWILSDADCELSLFGQGAYDILQLVKSRYSVDDARVYLTGLSMGSRGSQGLLAAYPDEFAAALLIAPAEQMSLAKWGEVAKSEVPVWFVTHIDDADRPVGIAHNSGKLRSMGRDYCLTIYPSTTYFSTSTHFSWIAAYADTEILDWMFAQTNQ